MKIFLNWKQNGSLSLIKNFILDLKPWNPKFEVSLFLPSLYLSYAQDLPETKIQKITISAQNVSSSENGPFTGEIGAEMLSDIKISQCLVGHSERRSLFNETDETIERKIENLLRFNILPILCIGESIVERENNKFLEHIRSQMQIFKKPCILAYEPIWAIGSGITPSIFQITEIADFIYDNLGVKILYGGSVNEQNIKEITQIKNIEGVLVGGASISSEKVNKMLQI